MINACWIVEYGNGVYDSTFGIVTSCPASNQDVDLSKDSKEVGPMIGVGLMVGYIIKFFVALFIVNAMFFVSIGLINMAWTGSRYLYRRVREWSREQSAHDWWRTHHVVRPNE